MKTGRFHAAAHGGSRQPRHRRDVCRTHARRPGAPRLAHQQLRAPRVPGQRSRGRRRLVLARSIGQCHHGDWRKVFSGNSTYKDNFAAGTAFLVIRRSDAKGLQLSQPGDHAMVASVRNGMSGWIWTPQLARVYGLPLTNPVWILSTWVQNWREDQTAIFIVADSNDVSMDDIERDCPAALARTRAVSGRSDRTTQSKHEA